jgi:prophage DNA circulation protein
MTDILKQLQRASWRQIEFPVMGTRDFGFQHEQAEHRYLFINAQLVESIGRKNPTYKFVIPFREDIAVGPWVNLYTRVYPDFLDACQDPSRGVLVDPAHGALPAKCVSLREMMSVEKRDGVDVEAEFIRAPNENDIVEDLGTQIRTLEGARGMAGALDREIAKIPFRQQAPPEPTINPLDAVSAVANQAEVAVTKITSAFADAAFRVEKASASLESLHDAIVQPAIQQSARLRDALIGFEERTDPTGTRPLRKITTASDMTVSALARKLSMLLNDLVRLNPWLARTPFVQAGSDIRVFADTISPANARTSSAPRAG